MIQLDSCVLTTPLGEVVVVFDASGSIHACEFADRQERLQRFLDRQAAVVVRGERQKAPQGLAEAFQRYFSGQIDALGDLPLTITGTAFQRRVWQALRHIPAGTTQCYQQLAQALGRPKSARAVGQANGANPFEMIVPCHRLVGTGGALTGYAGGLARKRWLLDHEARYAALVSKPSP